MVLFPSLLQLSVLGLALLSWEQASARTVPHPDVFRLAQRTHPESRTLLLDPTCRSIQSSISSASKVYAPGTIRYLQDMGTSTALLSPV